MDKFFLFVDDKFGTLTSRKEVICRGDSEESGPGAVIGGIIVLLILFAIARSACGPSTDADMTRKEILDQSVMCTIGENINLRACASRKCTSLDKLSRGEQVSVKGYEKGWVEVTYGGGLFSSGTTGYISRELIAPCH